MDPRSGCTPAATGNHLDEVVIRPGSPIAGKTLRASNLREGYGAIVVATGREDGEQIDYNPTSDRVITPGQTLILLGPHDRLQELQQQESTS